jgi:hypothetical protein
MKEIGSAIYWFATLVDIFFMLMIKYFIKAQDYNGDQVWFAFSVLLLFRIVSIWVLTLFLVNVTVRLKRWENVLFWGYVAYLIGHSIWWFRGMSKLLFS